MQICSYIWRIKQNYIHSKILQHFWFECFWVCNCRVIKNNIEEKYNNKLIELDKENKFYSIKLNVLNTERLTDLEAAKNFEDEKK